MVIDNADDMQLFFQTKSEDGADDNAAREQHNLGHYIPECLQGSVLITTRNKKAGSRLVQGRSPIQVKEMDQTEAGQLVLKMLDDTEVSSDDLSLLSSRLECLPLALAQAAAFIQENTISVSEYVRLLDDGDHGLVDRLSEPFETAGRDSDTPQALTATWIISFEQIERQDALASDLLSFISLLDRQAIPKEFVTHYCECERPEDSTTCGPAEITKALGTLKAFCFISEAKDHSFALHRLVQLVTQKWLLRKNKMGQFAENALATVTYLYPDGDDVKNWEICSMYLPHAYAVIRNGGSGSGDEELAKVDLHHQIGIYYLELGRWKEAEGMFWQCVDITRRMTGEEHPDTLARMGNLAVTYRSQGRFKEAEELELQVLEMDKRELGEEHPQTLKSMNNLAATYWKQGRFREAEELGLQVLDIRKRVLGEEHPQTLMSINNLATTYCNQGRYKEAEELGLQVLETRKRVLGEEHPRTLVSMNNLAFTWHDQGDRQNAIGLLQECLLLRTRVLGRDHPYTLTSSEYLQLWLDESDENVS